MKIGIVGLGLIGGSLGLKLQTLKNDYEKEKHEILEEIANLTESNGSTKQ